MTEDASHPTDERTVPPYVSFKTLLSLIERMEKPGPPPRIDRSYLVGMSGTSQSQVMASLRDLGLTDEKDNVSPLLTKMVQDRDGRPGLFADLLREKFPTLVALGEQNATHGQLEEEVRRLGRTGDSGRKAVAFFLQAAVYAGLPLSPHFTAPKATSSRPNSSRRRIGTKGRRGPRPAGDQDSNAGQTPSTSGYDMKRIYFDLLVEKAKQSDNPDSELLNRIERVIGIEAGDNVKTELRSDARVQTEAVPDGSKPED